MNSCEKCKILESKLDDYKRISDQSIFESIFYEDMANELARKLEKLTGESIQIPKLIHGGN